jgi:hypothetical protein
MANAADAIHRYPPKSHAAGHRRLSTSSPIVQIVSVDSAAVNPMRQRRCATSTARSERRAPELFSQAGISLPALSGPTNLERLASYSKVCRPASLRVLHAAGCRKPGTCDGFLPVQFSFNLRTPPDPFHPLRRSVIELVPRSRGVYLNCGVFDVFRDLPAAGKAALRLEANGIWMLGLLVQMSERDVKRLGSVDQPALEAMKLHLGKIGMSFEMRIPWWNRDNRAFVSATRTAVRACLPL